MVVRQRGNRTLKGQSDLVATIIRPLFPSAYILHEGSQYGNLPVKLWPQGAKVLFGGDENLLMFLDAPLGHEDIRSGVRYRILLSIFAVYRRSWR